MSNFAFLDNEDFRKHPSCDYLYRHASYAEASYYRHAACAREVRFILEQFCIFVSEIKGADYPKKVSMLGDYWGGKNKVEFYKAFGHENARQIKHANMISRSYMHSTNTVREDIYPEMLQSVYILLLWLYKELGFRTPLKYSDYSVKNIPSSDAGPAEEPLTNICHSPEALLKRLKDFYPDCNTDQLCNVVKLEDRYVITDMSGRQTEEFIPAVKYQDAERERSRLREQLEETGREFEAVKKDFLNQQSSQEAYIQELKEQIAAMEQQNRLSGRKQSREISNLQAQLQEQNEKRNAMAEGYKKSLKELGSRYDLLQEQYEELVPLKEMKCQMQQQIKELIREREEQEKNFSDIHEKMLGEIAGMKQRLADGQQTIQAMGVSARENQELIRHLVNGLAEKEKELAAAKRLAEEKFQALQAETMEIIRRYKDKAGSLDIILTNVMAENARFRENAVNYRHVEEVKDYLQLVNHGITEIEQGYALYQQNRNEQQLRSYLWKVKNYYDSKIENLEKALKEKEEKLEQERQRNNALFEALWEERRSAQTAGNTPAAEAESTHAAGNVSPVETENGGPAFRLRNTHRIRRKRRRRWRAALSFACLALLVLLLVFYRDRLSGIISDIFRKEGGVPEDYASDGVRAGMSAAFQESGENDGSMTAMLPEEVEGQEEDGLRGGIEASNQEDMPGAPKASDEGAESEGAKASNEGAESGGAKASNEGAESGSPKASSQGNESGGSGASSQGAEPGGTKASNGENASKENGEALEESRHPGGGNPDGKIPPDTSAVPTEGDKETEQRQGDQILDEAQKERERLEALPKLVEEISGISQDLLDDMETMRGNFKTFYSVLLSGTDTEDYHCLGIGSMFDIERTIYQIDSLKAGKFVYGFYSSAYARAFTLAVEPEAICADISYHTTLAELEAILGEAALKPYAGALGTKPTPFSEEIEDGNYQIAEFEYPLSWWHHSQYITVVYNEDLTEIVDYVYVQEDVKEKAVY